MPRLDEVATLAERITADAAAWYERHDVPSAFRGLHPLVLARARLESGGDWQRCAVDPDRNSVVVFNHRVWERQAE